MEEAYRDPDQRAISSYDDVREVRTRWFGDHAITVVVDLADGRVVTAWISPRR
ncbi:MAG TPA: hypothetical protein VIM30_02285 [Candidatus Limnocylindrales bacterium]|jgi:hypothetical protein